MRVSLPSAVRITSSPSRRQGQSAATPRAVSHFSATPHAPWRAGPTIGEHNEQILKDLLGFTDDEITDLAIADVLT